MGNKQSKIKRSPHEILGLPPTSTKQEVRDQYKRLILKAHPDVQRVHASNASAEASEIIGAYTAIMKSPPVFEFYTEDLFRSDLRRYADDFFERICDYCGLNAPKFSDPEFENFYQIFTNFRTQKEFDTREDKDAFCLNVRRTARMVKTLDRRVCISMPVASEKKAVPVKMKEKKVKVYPFNCEYCKKGFNSSNQIVNHYKSRKHFGRMGEVVENPKEHIESQILEVVQSESVLETQDSSKEESSEKIEEKTAVEQEMVDKTKREFKLEPLVFRTCAKCKIAFKTRSELFSHLKTTHAG